MKKLIKLLLSSMLVLILTIIPFQNILAQEVDSDDTEVEFTETIALEMGERFIEGIEPDKNINVDNAIKFCDESGEPLGYIVNFYYETESYGYVIFDTTVSGLIAEYSIGQQAKNPYEVICEKSDTDIVPYNNDESKEIVYKLSPFTYGVMDVAGQLHTNDGTLDNYKIEPSKEVRGKDPTTWSKVMINISDIYEDYSLVSTNHLNQFISFNESMVESKTGHYACAVSALLACSAYYGTCDYTNIKDTYMEIWNATATTEIYTKNGIIYGSTNNNDIGSGFVSYCADNDVNVTSRTTNNPTFNFFTSCIDRSDIAVVCCGIIDESTNDRQGHAMAVEGYATISEKTTGKTVHTLMIFDGWYDNVRYLNFDFGGWTDIAGVAFNG